MHFAKFTAYDGLPVYVNPMNINRIYESELTGKLTCIDMIGERDEQGTYFVVREPIEKVIGVLESQLPSLTLTSFAKKWGLSLSSSESDF